VTLKELLESLPTDAFVPVGWIREQLAGNQAISDRWVPLARVAEITRQPLSTVRGWAGRWSGEGPIRFRKRGSCKGSPWEGEEGDAFRWARDHNIPVLEVTDPVTVVDSEEALLSHYERLATREDPCPAKKSSGATASARRATTA
jgi:hypothetical protein